jgi:transcriptional regulator with XRE-family HTH domain
MVLKAKDNRAVKQPRLHLTQRFPDLIAQAGLSQRAFARRAGVSFSTIMGLMHPELHPGRRGGMQRRTAWLLAQAYAAVVQIDRDDAFRLLIVEDPAERSPDLGVPS